MFYNVLEILTQVHSANKWLVNVFCCFVLQFLKNKFFCFGGFLRFFSFVIPSFSVFSSFSFFFFFCNAPDRKKKDEFLFTSLHLLHLYTLKMEVCAWGGGKREKEPVFNFLVIHHKISNYFL